MFFFFKIKFKYHTELFSTLPINQSSRNMVCYFNFAKQIIESVRLVVVISLLISEVVGLKLAPNISGKLAIGLVITSNALLSVIS